MVDWTAVDDPEEWYREVTRIVARLGERAQTVPHGITVDLGSLDTSHDAAREGSSERPGELLDCLRDALVAPAEGVSPEVKASVRDLVAYLDELERETGAIRTTHLRTELVWLARAVRRTVAEHSSRELPAD